MNKMEKRHIHAEYAKAYMDFYREWYKKLIAKGLTDEDVAEMMHKNESFMKRIREGRKEDQNDEDRVDSIC